MAVQLVCLLLARRARDVLFFLTIEASRLYPSLNSRRGCASLAEYLRGQLAQEGRGSVSKGLAVLHSLVAAIPIVPSLLIAYIVAERRLPAGRPMVFALAVAFVLCAAIALTLVSRLRLRMLRFVTLIPVVLSVAAVLKLGAASIDQKLSARPLAV